MPITAWICKPCGGREVPLDHFETTDCGLKIHPDFAAAVLYSERSHYRFGQRAIGITDTLGCPRAAAIKHEVDYAVDPLTLNAPLTGTAWHAYMEEVASDNNVEVEVGGTIAGDGIITSVDRLRPALGLIEDWKNTNDFAVKYVKEKPKDEAVAQLAIGGELMQQTLGWRPTRGMVWYHNAASPGLTPHMVDPLPSLDWALAMRPHEGTATVRDSLVWMGRWKRQEVKWEDMPLTGESFVYGGGKTGCDYCPVQRVCWTQAKGTSF
jgi:hypothetical protein